MKTTPSTLSPLEAYEALMLFARRRGEGALRLAMHAAVPQSFRPDLLHLLKLNFLPRELHDPAAEADVLFSPLCEETGRGYFEFGPHVRTLLLDNLAANYASDRTPRIQRVANFLLFYVEHAERRAAGGLDRLRRDYLEVQRWVALAFLDPDDAARQLAAALKGTATPTGEFAARLRLGGLASALSSPLVKYRHVLNYAAGLQALEAGDHARAKDLLAGLGDEELDVGGIRLRPAADLLRAYSVQSPAAAPPTPEEAQPTSSEPSGDVPPGAPPPFDPRITEWVGTLSAATDSEQKLTAIRALEALKGADVPAAVEALIDTAWLDEDARVRLAAVSALSKGTSESALEAILVAAGDEDSVVRSVAAEALLTAPINPVLIFGFFGTDHVENREVLREELRRRGYAPLVFPYTRPPLRDAAVIARATMHLFSFIIADFTAPPEIQEDLAGTLELFLSQTGAPLVPIHQGVTLSKLALDLRRKYPSVLPLYSYAGAGELREAFDRAVIEPVAAGRREVDSHPPAPPQQEKEQARAGLYREFLDNFKGDSEQQSLASYAAGEYLNRYGGDTSPENAAIVQYIQRWLEKYEEATTDYIGRVLEQARSLAEESRFEEALEAYDHALKFSPRVAEVWAGRGEVLRSQGNLEAALASYQKAYELAREQNDVPRQARLTIHLGDLHMESGGLQEALEFYNQGRAAFEEVGDKSGLAMALEGLGFLSLRTSRYHEALRLFEQCLVLQREVGVRGGEALTLYHLSHAQLGLDRPGDALDTCRHSLDIFTELKDLRGQSLALDGMGRALEQVGRTEEALGVLRRRLEIEEQLGDRGRVAEALNNLGGLLQRIGRLDEGGETFERSYVIWRELGDVPRMAAALKGRGSVFEAMGNVEVAVAAYEEALRLSPDDEEVRRRLEGVSRSERPPPEPSEAA